MTRSALRPWLLISSFVLATIGSFACSNEGSVGVDDPDGSLADGSTPDLGPGADGGVPAPPPPTAPPIPGLTALRIDPTSATVVDDGVAPGETSSFRALGMFASGERDVTDSVAWFVEDDRLGAVEAGVFTSAGVGGRSRVAANAGDLTATAELTVVLEVLILDPSAPPDAASLFPDDTSGDTTGDAAGPRVLYPSHETMLPRNLAPVNAQWSADARFDVFELRFDSESAHFRFYTTARSLAPAADVWAAITETHAGASATLSVRAVARASPGAVFRSQENEILFSRSAVLGALYYWSTGAQGVMRGHIAAASAIKFFSDPTNDDNTCVACHTVSRDGRRLAVAFGGERLREVTIPERDVLIPADPADQGPEYGWGTFNPGATRLLYASKGAMRLLDADTGATIADVALPEESGATHPDWSPDGRYVAVAYVEPGGRMPGNKDVQGSSLARIPVMPDGTFGEPEVLVASTADDDTLFFPSYSPDSRWIAFVRARGKSKDNRTSELFLVRADGTGEPVLVTRLNERVADRDGESEIGNSMPTWAPSTSAEIFWLAFSSLRDYGSVLVGTERDQLWGAAIDPAALEAGRDASFAAFWMPFQDAAEGNHRAFWAIAAEDDCPSTFELCDELDNDCDAIVDEDCCAPVTEMCGNGMDDDCDGEADEGCGCAPTEENCSNDIDDDCDLLTDSADEDCVI